MSKHLKKLITKFTLKIAPSNSVRVLSKPVARLGTMQQGENLSHKNREFVIPKRGLRKDRKNATSCVT